MMDFLISQAERHLGAPLDYLRHIAATSLRLFARFSMILVVGSCRRNAPKPAFHVACLTVTLLEDCGACVQIAINEAKRDGVPLDVIRAVVHGRPDDLSDDLRAVHALAAASIRPGDALTDLREQVRALYGEAALIELAMGMAAARVFPFTKRVLGFAESCSLKPPTI